MQQENMQQQAQLNQQSAQAASQAEIQKNQALTAGTTLARRWKLVGSTANDQIVCYLKAAPTQTF